MPLKAEIATGPNRWTRSSTVPYSSARPPYRSRSSATVVSSTRWNRGPGCRTAGLPQGDPADRPGRIPAPSYGPLLRGQAQGVAERMAVKGKTGSEAKRRALPVDGGAQHERRRIRVFLHQAPRRLPARYTFPRVQSSQAYLPCETQCPEVRGAVRTSRHCPSAARPGWRRPMR